MQKSMVALVRCEEYDADRVYQAVLKGISLIGGISAYVKPGERIVLKPNCMFGIAPQKSVTTHPAVFSAVGKILLENGAGVSFGDLPGFGGSEISLKRSGLKGAADDLGIPLADFDHGKSVEHKNALLIKRMTVANGVLELDGLVSLPKLKTHALVRFTGAIKNQFGCIPGLLKPQFHVKLIDPYDFATMLVDINTLVRPRLFVMDAIWGMEGNGPRNGKPRRMNLLLFSSDPVAMDAVACKLVDMNPIFVPTSAPGERSGLGTYHDENIEIVGDEIEQFRARDFDIVRKPPVSTKGNHLKRFLKTRFVPGR